MKNYNMLYLLLIFTFMIGSISATPLTDWTASDVWMADDPSGEMTIFHTSGNPIRPLSSGEDMIKAFYRFDNGTHYFRMDLLDTPSGISYAPEYSLQIDYTAGGLSHGNPADNDTMTYYVASPLAGIDVILTSHYSNGVYLSAVFRHRFEGTETSNLDMFNLWDLAGGAFQNTENNGKTLEWAIAASELNGSGPLDAERLWFVTHDVNAGDGGTYDLAQAVPESNSICLFATGLAIFFLASFSIKRVSN